VRRKPYSIVLLEEIEKANLDVWNTVLQIMDDGRLTDSKGRMVSFKNTILIMTSNLGAREITGKSSLGFSAAASEAGVLRPEEMKDRVMDAVKQAFPPEFINRLDEVIVFHSLEKDHIRKIAGNLTSRLIRRMQGQGVELRIDTEVIDLLAEKGYDPMYGARPLRRTIQTMLEDKLADYLLEIDAVEGCQIEAVLENGEICLKPGRV
ncbi:MAG: AAA family ATPase, partial [Lachnospiraceae bacterium]|nr:AAA family ATPase [Lachnospiraceae bacterium]